MNSLLTAQTEGGTSRGGDTSGVVRFPLAALIMRYTSTRQRRGEMTRDNAARTQRRLMHFAALAPEDPNKVTRAHVYNYIERPDLAASTRRMMLSDIRTLFRWLITEGYAKRDPTIGVGRIEQPPRVPGALRVDQADELRRGMRQLDDRARLVVSLEFNEALRRVEVARCQMSDIDRRGKTIRVRGKAAGGRGEVTREVPLSPETIAALDAYLASEPGILGVRSIESGPLIRNRNDPHKGVGVETIGRLVTGALYALGVKTGPNDSVAGHALRHTAATEASELGVPKEVIQDMLGHASIATTEIYTKGAVRSLRQFHERRTEARDEDVIDLREDQG